MTGRIRLPRATWNGGATDGDALPDNRLALLDQAFYAGHCAAGQKEVMQVALIYERAIDLGELRRFHRNLPYGLLGRRIERSPLRFGRYRWVADRQPSELDIADCARPRTELAAWLDERSLLPIDPETGPGWRLSVLPFTDGSTAVTLVISHYVIDGIGAVIAIALAGMGEKLDLGYPPPRSRSWTRALVQDAGETVRDAPGVARALLAAAKAARGGRQDVAETDTSRSAVLPAGGAIHPVTVPAVWIRINMAEWNARAAALGGTSSTLSAAFTAKLDRDMGRHHGGAADVKMLLLVNDRTMGDLRAIAVSFARVSIDPTGITADLRKTRTAIKHALKTLRETPDESAPLVPLTPFAPKRAWRRAINYALNDPEHPAVCSNLGDTGPAVIRLDGAPCDSAFARGMSQHLTQQWLDRMGSQLQVYCGTSVEINKIGIHVRAYQLGTVTTKAALHELVERVLADFGLSGEID